MLFSMLREQWPPFILQRSMSFIHYTWLCSINLTLLTFLSMMYTTQLRHIALGSFESGSKSGLRDSSNWGPKPSDPALCIEKSHGVGHLSDKHSPNQFLTHAFIHHTWLRGTKVMVLTSSDDAFNQTRIYATGSLGSASGNGPRDSSKWGLMTSDICLHDDAVDASFHVQGHLKNNTSLVEEISYRKLRALSEQRLSSFDAPIHLSKWAGRRDMYHNNVTEDDSRRR